MPTPLAEQLNSNNKTCSIVCRSKIGHILEQYLSDLQKGRVSNREDLQEHYPHVAHELNPVGKLEVSSVLAFLEWLDAKKYLTKREAGSGVMSWSEPLCLLSKASVYRWADQVFLVSCLVIIFLVSVADTWLAFSNDNILNVEVNPLCTWLLSIDAESCGYFVAGKICGTLLVLLTLLKLLRLKYRHARLVLAAVTIFQIGLLAYIFLSDPFTDGWFNFQALFDAGEPSVFGRFVTADLN